jgi:hypothetical protein
MPYKLDPRFRIATLGMSSVFILAVGDEVPVAANAPTAAAGASGSGAADSAAAKSKKQLKREAKGPVKEKKEKPVRMFSWRCTCLAVLWSGSTWEKWCVVACIQFLAKIAAAGDAPKKEKKKTVEAFVFENTTPAGEKKGEFSRQGVKLFATAA